ncbi:hypothetical protein SBI67_19755 [Mycolicibacterium sp. 120266]|uniref:hypothetical protein n=1 Tax=Mycolicibacterium sp. 120266 TaxID=3090601 RepID=UPI00299EAA66|nr:hypothetical protein [Mycolicibacterium sp. 120266]MDX1874362.1 hypothetical protein [Mycolicibacterium sp. 120266]
MFDIHHRLTGRAAGRRHDAEHLLGAIVARLVAEFQGYCRDVHDEAVDHVVGCLGITDAGLLALTRTAYIRRRDLSTGNPTWKALENDFGRLDMRFTREMDARFTTAPALRRKLDDLMFARNAFVHAEEAKLQRCRDRNHLWLRQMRIWRTALNRLTGSIDTAVGAHLKALTGQNPW